MQDSTYTPTNRLICSHTYVVIYLDVHLTYYLQKYKYTYIIYKRVKFITSFSWKLVQKKNLPTNIPANTKVLLPLQILLYS